MHWRMHTYVCGHSHTGGIWGESEVSTYDYLPDEGLVSVIAVSLDPTVPAYEFRIRALNLIGPSDWSEVVTYSRQPLGLLDDRRFNKQSDIFKFCHSIVVRTLLTLVVDDEARAEYMRRRSSPA